MSRTVPRGALVALLAISLSLLGVVPASAGNPISCESQSWTWAGTGVDNRWEDADNWMCDGGEAGDGYPDGAGHIANFVNDATIDGPVVLPQSPEGQEAIILHELNFVGGQSFELTGGDIVLDGGPDIRLAGEEQPDERPRITNTAAVPQALNLTVYTGFTRFNGIPSGDPVMVEGNAPVFIDRLAGAAVELDVQGAQMTLTVRALDVAEGLAKLGAGALIILEDLNDLTGGTLLHVHPDSGLVRIEAEELAGPIIHDTPSGQTEVAPGGAAVTSVIQPGCGFCGSFFLERPDLGSSWAGASPCSNCGPPVAAALFEGSTYEVDVQPLQQAELPFPPSPEDVSADLIFAHGGVYLEAPELVAESSSAFNGITELGAGTLEVSVQGALQTGDLYPIVFSYPSSGPIVDSAFAGEEEVEVEDLCDVTFPVPFGICGEFDGYPDGTEFTADGYRFRIDYLQLSEVEESDTFAAAGPAWSGFEIDVTIAVALEVLGRVPTPPPPTDPSVAPAGEPVEPVRLGGGERIETSVIGSQEAFEDGAADAVVLATADNAADAVAGTPFAVAMDGPILLTDPDTLTPIVAEEITRILPAGGTVFVMGLQAAIDDSVLAEIEDLGYAVERVGGANRFGTAVEVADRLLGSGFAQADEQALLADGHGFVAATIAGPAAAATGGVVLLTAAENMAPETAEWLTEHPEVVTTAIGREAAQALPKAEAIEADTPPALSVAVAEAYFVAPAVTGLATHGAFPDPLTGGTHVALLGGPLLLSDTDALPQVVADYVTAIAEGLDEVFVYGGTAALSDAVVDDLNEALAG